MKLTVEQISEERHNTTPLLSWLQRKDFDLYVVLTDAQSAAEQECGIFINVVRRFRPAECMHARRTSVRAGKTQMEELRCNI